MRSREIEITIYLLQLVTYFSFRGVASLGGAWRLSSLLFQPRPI